MNKTTLYVLRDYGLTILAAIAIALFLRTFIVEAYRVANYSMKPALLAGDTIFVEKWHYRLWKPELPKRGDVVVFSGIPSRTSGSGSPDFIKRVIGLPGDEVKVQAGQIYLNGKPLSNVGPNLGTPSTPNAEPPSGMAVEVLPDGRHYQILLESPLLENFGPERVPEGSVFVIGDLRSGADAKARPALGMVPLSALRGKATWVWLSVEPQKENVSGSLFSRLRIGRMFQRIM